MRREKEQWGGYHDGRGLRYSIAELYFQLGDFKKTNRYISWFDKNFPDDSTYAYFQLGVALTKFHAKKEIECKRRVINIISHNTYLLYLIIGTEINDQNKYEWHESESLKWAKEHLVVYKEFLDQNFVTWLSDFLTQDNFKRAYSKYISIKKQLKGMNVSEERSKLLDGERECINLWKEEIEKYP